MTKLSVKLHPDARRQLEFWEKNNPKVASKIAELILYTQETPFVGLGKPEPLRHNYKGCWSRRITDEHRLIYRVQAGDLMILRCYGHYDD